MEEKICSLVQKKKPFLVHLFKSDFWGVGKWQEICVFFILSSFNCTVSKRCFQNFLFYNFVPSLFFTTLWKCNIQEELSQFVCLVLNIFFTLNLFLHFNFRSTQIWIFLFNSAAKLTIELFTASQLLLKFFFPEVLGPKTMLLCSHLYFQQVLQCLCV